MKTAIQLAAAIAGVAFAMGCLPSNSVLASSQKQNDIQTILTNSLELNRAKNRARRAAEEANGGLSQYRAEDAMHGPAEESPFVDNGDGTWTFTVLGRRPTSNILTLETVVTVSRDGKLVTVDYNGPIRR